MIKKTCTGAVFQAPAQGFLNSSGFDLIFHSIAFSLDQHGFRVVQQSVKDGRGQSAVVIKNFRPIFKGLVGGNYQSPLLIASANDLEQKV